MFLSVELLASFINSGNYAGGRLVVMVEPSMPGSSKGRSQKDIVMTAISWSS